MTKQAWFCPACQKHHAPHVETCPAPVDAIGTKRYGPITGLPDTTPIRGPFYNLPLHPQFHDWPHQPSRVLPYTGPAYTTC